MKQQFIDWNPTYDTRELLSYITKVLQDYRRQGYILTVRQLYYQLVSQDLIANSVKSYHRLVGITSKGRLAGMIDWRMIEDRGRKPIINAHWDDPKEILQTAVNAYYTDRWRDQDSYVEVWCEKDAVSNILAPVCQEWDVTFMANKGYSSQSAMYAAFGRFSHQFIEYGKGLNILYFGDHDPSGIDMIRDIDDRMCLFLDSELECESSYSGLSVRRIALSMEQVDKHNPPENPTKTLDPRYKTYQVEFGDSSWELDALSPDILSGLVEVGIKEFLDLSLFEEVAAEEEEAKEKMKKHIEDF